MSPKQVQNKNNGKRTSTLRVTIKRFTDNIGKFKGKLTSGASTDDSKPNLTGILSSRLAKGQKLRIYASAKSSGKAKLLGIAKVKGKKWSFTPAKKLISNRRYFFTAQVTDAKGNRQSKPSEPKKLVIDSEKPTLKIKTKVNKEKRQVSFIFSFSEAVKGFKKSDISINGKPRGVFSKINNKVYKLVLTQKLWSRRKYRASVSSGAASDLAGNANKATKSKKQTLDAFQKNKLSGIADGRTGFAIYGENAYDLSGRSVSSAGDVNGDGLTDLIIGAPGANSNSGKTYVIYGTKKKRKKKKGRIQLSKIASGKGGFVIYGESAGSGSGEIVSSAGDVNGDGIDDVIIGAQNWGNGTGSAYVVFGKRGSNSAIKLSDIAAGIGGFVIRGEGENDHCGMAVGSAGDVNGDGLADLLVGAKYAGKQGNGRSYIVYGKKGNNKAIQLSDIAAGFGGILIEAEPLELSENGTTDLRHGNGNYVTSGGDINGDGINDVVIGANGENDDPSSSSSPYAYVLYGGRKEATAVQLSDIAAGNGGFVVYGEPTSGRSQRPISSSGDINGDGIDDLIMGVPADSTRNKSSSNTYVIFGTKLIRQRPVNLSLIAAGVGGFVIRGKLSYNNSGISVSASHDYNNDGIDDVLIGAPGQAYSGNNNRSYVVFGKKGSSRPTVELSKISAGKEGFVLSGGSKSNFSGISVDYIDDFNGDGRAEMIIGSPGAKGYAGMAYVIF